MLSQVLKYGYIVITTKKFKEFINFSLLQFRSNNIIHGHLEHLGLLSILDNGKELNKQK